jgi:hypothetical protein
MLTFNVPIYCNCRNSAMSTVIDCLSAPPANKWRGFCVYVFFRVCPDDSNCG